MFNFDRVLIMLHEHIKFFNSCIKLTCKAAIGVLLLNACQTSENTAPTTLPPFESLDLSTDNKPKKAVETPTGVKYVYDPHQDEDLKIAFRALMQIKQQAGYFSKGGQNVNWLGLSKKAPLGI